MLRTYEKVIENLIILISCLMLTQLQEKKKSGFLLLKIEMPQNKDAKIFCQPLDCNTPGHQTEPSPAFSPTLPAL